MQLRWTITFHTVSSLYVMAILLLPREHPCMPYRRSSLTSRKLPEPDHMPHNYRTLLRARTRSLMLYPDCCNEQVSGPYTTRLRDNMLHNNQLSGCQGIRVAG